MIADIQVGARWSLCIDKVALSALVKRSFCFKRVIATKRTLVYEITLVKNLTKFHTAKLAHFVRV